MMVPLLDADTNFTGVNQHCHEISAHLPLSNVKYSSCLPAHSVPNGGSPTSRGRGMIAVNVQQMVSQPKILQLKILICKL